MVRLFDLYIYQAKLNTNANGKKLVSIGKIAIITAMLIAVVATPFLEEIYFVSYCLFCLKSVESFI